MASKGWAFARENRARIVDEAQDGKEEMLNQHKPGWSYIVSAMYKTAMTSGEYEVFSYVPYILDLVLHLGLWIVALIFECVIRFRDHRGSRVFEEVGSAAFYSLWLSFGGVFLSIIVGFVADLRQGALYPSIVSAITAGGIASAAFSALYWLAAVGDATYMSHHDATKTFATADHADDELVT